MATFLFIFKFSCIGQFVERTEFSASTSHVEQVKFKLPQLLSANRMWRWQSNYLHISLPSVQCMRLILLLVGWNEYNPRYDWNTCLHAWIWWTHAWRRGANNSEINRTNRLHEAWEKDIPKRIWWQRNGRQRLFDPFDTIYILYCRMPLEIRVLSHRSQPIWRYVKYLIRRSPMENIQCNIKFINCRLNSDFTNNPCMLLHLCRTIRS